VADAVMAGFPSGTALAGRPGLDAGLFGVVFGILALVEHPVGSPEQ